MIGSSPLGLYDLTGAGELGQDQLHYQIHDSTNLDTTMPGILATFGFKVGDCSIGTPTADSGDYSTAIGTAAFTDDRTPITSDAALESRFKGAPYETFLRDASVVVDVRK